MSNWIEYHTHILNTQMLNFGVTEAELIVAGVQFGTYFFGQDMWSVENRYVLPYFITGPLEALNLPIIEHILSTKLCQNIAYFLIIMMSIIFVVGLLNTLYNLKTDRIEAVLQFIPLLMIIYIGKRARCD